MKTRTVLTAVMVVLSLLVPTTALADMYIIRGDTMPKPGETRTLSIDGGRWDAYAPAAPKGSVVGGEVALLLLRPRIAPRRRQQRDGLINGTLVGAAIGAGYGGIVLSKTHGDLTPTSQWILVPSTAGIGAAIGLLVDFLRR